uniref:Serpentine receptor class gamma n=1 Tax=Panagrellus redivivus TaxID=6233 RepID=A0A7E4VJJ1_PANRE
MKVFANLIIQATIVDMVSSVVMFFMQLIVEAKDGIVFTGSGNPWLPLSGQWRCMPVMIFPVTNNMSFWSVPIQALYRYLVIKTPSITMDSRVIACLRRCFRRWYNLSHGIFVGTELSPVTKTAVNGILEE